MVYSDKAWSSERIFDSDMDRMENGIGGRCARAVVDPGGAKGDYATIQAAINALTPASHGMIFLKKGIYDITATLTAPVSTENFAIVGEPGTIIRANVATPPDPMMQIGVDLGAAGKNVHLSNLTFDVNGKNVDALEVYVMNQFWADKLRFVDGVGGGAGNQSMFIKSCDDAHITDCYWDNISSTYALSLRAIQRGIVKGNLAYDIKGFLLANACEQMQVIGNAARDPKASTDLGMSFELPEWLSIIGNSFYGQFQTAIVIDTDYDEVVIDGNVIVDTGGGIETSGVGAGAKNLVISNNVIRNLTGLMAAIEIAQTFQAENVVIDGNVIDLCQRQGVFVDNTRGLIVTNNQVRDVSQIANNTWDGIEINGCTYVVVNGNNIQAFQANKMRYGVNESGGGNFMNAVGNISKGGQTGHVNVTGAGSVKANNIELA